MTKKFYETDKFLSEQKVWDKKLRDSGFHDIESGYDKDNGTGRKPHFDVHPARIAYFEKCKEFLHSYKFADEVDHFIFEKHCEGITNRTIVQLLEMNGLKALKHVAVAARILKILKTAEIEPMSFKL